MEYLKENGFDIEYKPEITAGELKSLIENFQVLLVRSRTKVTGEIINGCRQLKIIGRIGSGYDNIDLESCLKKKIKVINAPDANSQSVAELTVGLMITLLRKLETAFTSMRKGYWLKDELWGNELSGKTVGIVGYGYVGRRVGRILKSFKCNLLIYSRSFKTASLEELFSKSDIITLHPALTSRTEKMINNDLLSKMKRRALIINISRGKIIDENALFYHLKNKLIQGAALDVFTYEPLQKDNRWRTLSNVILTPHIGAATEEALIRASMTVAEDLVRIIKGHKARYSVI